MRLLCLTLSIQAAADIRADPMLNEACKDDSESLCKNVKKGGGRIQACLVSGSLMGKVNEVRQRQACIFRMPCSEVACLERLIE